MLEQPSGGQGVGGGGDLGGDPVMGESADERADAVIEDASGSCEDELAALAAENASLKARIAEMEASMALAEARHALERLLVDAGVIDLETALTLAEPELVSGEPAEAVASGLVAGKPFLFAGGAAPGRSTGLGSAMGTGRGEDRSPLSSLADEARRTGDRGALTRYLRRRRLG